MSTLDRIVLCRTFRELSLWTNQIIQKGMHSGLGILEETITDYVLNEIASNNSNFIYTKKFSRRQEGCESGADWLWCIGSPGAWLTILVQAKIINPTTRKCHHLDYRGQQRLLLHYARTYRFLPLYCIYGFIDQTILSEEQSLSMFPECTTPDWACSFVSPKYATISITKHEKTQAYLLANSIPWMFPFCFAESLGETQLAYSFASSIQTAYERIAQIGPPSTVKGDEASQALSVNTLNADARKRIQWNNVDPTLLITPQIPRLVLRLLKSRVKQYDAPISTVSIVSDVPVESVLNEYAALPAPHQELPFFRGRKQREREGWRIR